MTRVTDFNNTWCVNNDNNLEALEKLKFLKPYDIKEDYPNRKKYDYIVVDDSLDYMFHYNDNGREIKLIGNDFYYVDEEKEQDSFNKFGFETPEFEGEILKEIGDYYIGYYQNVKDNGYYPCAWNFDGTICDGFDRDYNLAPIKKPWFENEDNFPCLVVYLKDNTIREIIKKEYLVSNEILRDSLGYGLELSKCRPLTKQEVLKLVIEE